MLIHAYRRKEAIEVELFGLKVEFKPNENRHCVAEVTHAAAINRFLSITEAFVEYLAVDGAATIPVAGLNSADGQAREPDVPKLLAAEGMPDEVPLAEDRFVHVDDLVRAAFERTGLSLEEWNALSDATRAQLLKDELATLRAGLRTTDEDDEAEAEREREESARELQEAEARAKAETDESKAGGAEGEANPLVLTDGETTIDISVMTAAQVRAMAAENKIELPAGNSTKVADLRLLLAKGLKGE